MRAGLVVTLGIVAWPYARVVAALVHTWSTDTYAVHGAFAPAFGVLLLWRDREALRSAVAPPSPWGIPVVLLGLLVLGAGWASQRLEIEAASLVIVLAGTVLWAFGAPCLRRAAFPLALQLFMIPLPREVVDVVSLDLQLFASSAAGVVLDLLGVPFYQQGAWIELPRLRLHVAEVCNGLRFMMAFLLLATVFGHVSQRRRCARLVVAASAVPLAIGANAARVTVVALAVHYWGPEAASGLIHHTIGKAVWVSAVVPLVGLGILLRRWPRGPRPAERPGTSSASGTS